MQLKKPLINYSEKLGIASFCIFGRAGFTFPHASRFSYRLYITKDQAVGLRTATLQSLTPVVFKMISRVQKEALWKKWAHYPKTCNFNKHFPDEFMVSVCHFKFIVTFSWKWKTNRHACHHKLKVQCPWFPNQIHHLLVFSFKTLMVMAKTLYSTSGRHQYRKHPDFNLKSSIQEMYSQKKNFNCSNH